jgi:GST-like protein
MRFTLYGFPGSGSVAIEMALRLLSLDYLFIRASTWEPGAAFNELKRVNPLGQIPTLVLDDGTVLTETAAILIHLGLEHPSALLLPDATSKRALALSGLVFIAANCYSAVSITDHPDRWTTATSKSAQVRVEAAARAQLHHHWEVFADTYGSEGALSQPEPGALAFMAVVVSSWSGTRAHLLKQRPRFLQTLLRLEEHPRLAAVLEAQQAV